MGCVEDLGLELRPVKSEEVTQAHALEKEGYPDDEAASLEMLQYRQKVASDLFLGMFIGETLIAYACSTRYLGPRFREESMKEHDPLAPCVCLHSICVHKDYRRQGLALCLLSSYSEQVKISQEKVVKIILLCKSVLIPLYTRAGYTLLGKSPIVHGKDKWYEMEQFV